MKVSAFGEFMIRITPKNCNSFLLKFFLRFSEVAGILFLNNKYLMYNFCRAQSEKKSFIFQKKVNPIKRKKPINPIAHNK